jgi:tripartite-type tricarboxylate transporter receptor subunit TctC
VVSERLGQPIAVDNRPGGSTNIGVQAVASADANGYTFGLVTPNFAINPTLYGPADFDPLTDLTGVASLVAVVDIIAVHPSLGISTLPELLDLARKDPGGMFYSSSGIGSASHLAVLLLEKMAEVRFEHIPYSGSGPAVTALLANEVGMGMVAAGSAAPYFADGSLVPIAVTSAERLPGFPDIPTVAEHGLEGYELLTWIGMIAPAGTPAEIVQRMSDEMLAAMELPEVSERLQSLGYLKNPMGPAEFQAFVESEVTRWQPIIQGEIDAGRMTVK